MRRSKAVGAIKSPESFSSVKWCQIEWGFIDYSISGHLIIEIKSNRTFWIASKEVDVRVMKLGLDTLSCGHKFIGGMIWVRILVGAGIQTIPSEHLPHSVEVITNRNGSGGGTPPSAFALLLLPSVTLPLGFGREMFHVFHELQRGRRWCCFLLRSFGGFRIDGRLWGILEVCRDIQFNLKSSIFSQ
jgi:hypothetical protein